jgi:hypothetical protein
MYGRFGRGATPAGRSRRRVLTMSSTKARMVQLAPRRIRAARQRIVSDPVFDMTTHRDFFMGIFVSLTTVVAGVAAIEIGLRVLDEPKWNAPTIAGWRSSLPREELNELGYRGQPIKYSDNDFVVLLIGDSQAESAACTVDKTPEHLLETRLAASGRAVKVFSLGAAGYGTDQEYLALEEYFSRYRADLALVWQTFTNDVWNNVFPTHMPKDGAIKPTYVLRDGQLEGPNYRLGEVVQKAARTKIGLLVGRLFHPQKGLDASWERYLPPAYRPLDRYDGPALSDWDPADPTNRNPYLANENPETEKSHYAVSLFPASRRMLYGLDLTRMLMRKMETLSKDKGADFAIFTVLPGGADYWDSSLPVDSSVVVHKRNGLYYRTSGEQQRANFNYLNAGFNFLPISIELENWRVSETDGHLNCRANEEAMERLAQKVAPYLDKRTQLGGLPGAR